MADGLRACTPVKSSFASPVFQGDRSGENMHGERWTDGRTGDNDLADGCLILFRCSPCSRSRVRSNKELEWVKTVGHRHVESVWEVGNCATYFRLDLFGKIDFLSFFDARILILVRVFYYSNLLPRDKIWGLHVGRVVVSLCLIKIYMFPSFSTFSFSPCFYCCSKSLI